MDKRANCPFCKYEVTTKPIKTWKFRIYDVSRYECEHCKKRFNLYESPNQTYTIPEDPQKWSRQEK